MTCRQWLELVESMGELKRIDGADWDLEIGTMAELIYRERTGTIPALLFDQIKGYPGRLSHSLRPADFLSPSGAHGRLADGQRGTEARQPIQRKAQQASTDSAAHCEDRTGF